MFKKTIYLFLFVLSCAFIQLARAEYVEDFHTWGNITATGSLDVIHPDLGELRYWLEGQGRFGDDSSRFSQAILRPGVGYALSKNASVWMGYAWIPNDKPFAQKPFDENRIWQQFIWNDNLPWALGNYSLRSRLEQRYMDIGDDVGWRFRQLLKTSLPFSFAPDLSLVLSNELFIDINRTDWKRADGIDQNRGFVGLGYNFDSHVRTEVGYMNHYIRRARNTDVMNHIMSINLYLNY